MNRRYANDTSVSIAKSRGEIEKTLRLWGARQMQWSDDFDGGRTMLRFIWENRGTVYTARFSINVPTSDDIRSSSLDGRSGRFSQKNTTKPWSVGGWSSTESSRFF